MDVFRTADGRELEYVEVGDPDGQPVMHLHGTPGTASVVAMLADAARRNGVRLVGVTRPGYAGSTTTAPGLAAVARDVGELATGLGVEEFTVLGVSGGGPFALATAATLPARVRRVLIAAGPGPTYLLAPEHIEPDDVQALELLAGGDVDGAVALVTAEAGQHFDALRSLAPDEFAAAMSANAPPNEHYFDTRPDERAVFQADFRRSLERYDGFVRDNLSWMGSWDFDLAHVVAPVDLYYGDSDAMVPATNGEWLAERLPKATLSIESGAGHGDISFGLAERLFAAEGRSA